MLTVTVCVALSAAGLAIAMLTAYRRRYLAATRTAALALLPVGLYMTGLVTLGRKVGTATGSWAADLVFKPSVWLGFGVLAVSAALYTGTRFAAGRDGGSRRERKAAAAAAGAPAVAPDASTPSLPAGRKTAAKTKSSADGGLSDFSDIEEILKRRGI
ncbi:hypothetical protein QMK19_14015 [Streptomyces sp. H10-C2]|uniref:hypothetical protein n=1 Tax=unclassified Streptomyces TaxID=2593676 RepID=UPI0024BA44C8|nr:MULTISPECIES: hypothetical protein [unclassified Streptomyces]MDJ0346332.1 hypothetical protein [Streptomyces sp. PH10-H1]MDJ0370769.1 hypothetical protein [Streptomyces sp. H10-C2]